MRERYLTLVATAALLSLVPTSNIQAAEVSVSSPLPHTVTFADGQAAIQGPTQPEWTKP
jgi:hypothetical protein